MKVHDFNTNFSFFFFETRGKIVWLLCWLSLIQLGMQSVHGMSSGQILGTATIYLLLLLRDILFFFYS